MTLSEVASIKSEAGMYFRLCENSKEEDEFCESDFTDGHGEIENRNLYDPPRVISHVTISLTPQEPQTLPTLFSNDNCSGLMQVPYQVYFDDIELLYDNYGYPLAPDNIGSIYLPAAAEATIYSGSDQTGDLRDFSAPDDSYLCEPLDMDWVGSIKESVGDD